MFWVVGKTFLEKVQEQKAAKADRLKRENRRLEEENQRLRDLLKDQK